MIRWILLLLLVFSTSACVAQRGPTFAELHGPTNYTRLITIWASDRHPHDPFEFKVKTVRPVLIEQGATGVLALQVHVFYRSGAESYILFIRNGKILSWLYAGEPEEDAEEESEEVFVAKDQA